MGSEYAISSIGDTCYVTDGAHAKVDRQTNGVLYLTSKNFDVGSLKLENVDFISEEDFQKLFSDTKKSQRRLRDGDVLTGIIGTFGNAYRYRSDDHFGISSSVAILRPNKNILDSDFLYYVVTSADFKATVAAYKGGSVQGYTNIATLKSLPIPLPEFESQKKIAEILKSLDNKITLNRQLNQTLEQMAQALFKSWFVDFDPVIDNALAAGNVIPDDLQDRALLRQGIRQQQLAKADHKPLPENIRKLFPSEFELTESLGWVPKGWGEVGLNKFIKFVNGKSKTSDDSGVFPLYGANGEIGRSNVEKFRNAIIIGRVGAYCGAIEFCLGGFWASDNTIVATPLIDEQSIGYVLYLLKYLELNQFAGGAAQPLLNQSVLGSIKFPDVSNEIVKLFNNISSGFLASIWQRKKEMDDLAQLRDTLLPKLISGELRIPEAESALTLALSQRERGLESANE